MFCGIVCEIGEVKKIVSQKGNTIFTIAAKSVLRNLKVGDSIAINGSCHTIVHKSTKTFEVESMPETLKRTNLKSLKVGDVVNLERPLKMNGSVDGHFVSGHIDGEAKVLKIIKDKNAHLFMLTIPKMFSKLIVEKGSIALDGVSLTIISIRNNQIVVGIIPHTFDVTTFGQRKVGDYINVEVDLLAKHIAKLVRKN